MGLPEVTLKELLDRKGAEDPLVVDAIREHCNFSKQIEGYPWFFNGNKFETQDGFHTEDMGPSDFYESLCVISRLNAAIT